MRFTSALALASSAAVAAAAPPPSMPTCTDMPACTTCLAHTFLGCNACSVPIVDKNGATVEDMYGNPSQCLSTKDSTYSCPTVDGAIQYGDGDTCFPGYRCSETQGKVEIDVDEWNWGGSGLQLNVAKDQCDASGVVQYQRANYATGDCEDTPEYTYDPDIDSRSCMASRGVGQKCDADAEQCQDDDYTEGVTSITCDCAVAAIPGVANHTFTSTDIQSDWGTAVWQYEFDDAGNVFIWDGAEMAHAQTFLTDRYGYELQFLNGSNEGQVMLGYYADAPNGPVSRSMIQVAAANFFDESIMPNLHDAMAGQGVGVQQLTRVDVDAYFNPPEVDANTTVEGTWRGFLLSEPADQQPAVTVWTFPDNETLHFYDPVVNATTVYSVDASFETGLMKLTDPDSGDVSQGILQYGGPGADGTGTRLMYAALGAPGEGPPLSFKSALTDDDAREWIFTACDLEDPEFCTFSRASV